MSLFKTLANFMFVVIIHVNLQRFMMTDLRFNIQVNLL